VPPSLRVGEDDLCSTIGCRLSRFLVKSMLSETRMRRFLAVAMRCGMGHRAFLSPMRSHLGTLLCGLAILQIIGGHWGVLQTTAWIGMIIQYSQHDGIEAGLSQTFDGAHPCSMCQAIKVASNQEQKKAPLLRGELKKDFLAEQNCFQVLLPWTEWDYLRLEGRMEGIVFRPALPPPRAV
jgi:hypothetical protein